MKRTLSLLLVLALCLAFVPAPAHAAAANPFDKQDNKLVSYSGGLYFGYTASETLNSTYKPHITVQTREYDAVPSGEIAVNITLSGDDLSNHWSASGLHIGYDTRLTLTNKTSGDAVSNLSIQSGNTSVSGVIFAATAGSSDKGRTGVMYTLHFTLPANAKAGDVYPIGIYYDGTDSGRKDLFTNVNQDEVGKQMQSYLLYGHHQRRHQDQKQQSPGDLSSAFESNGDGGKQRTSILYLYAGKCFRLYVSVGVPKKFVRYMENRT